MAEMKWVTIPKFPTYEINRLLEVRHKKNQKIKSAFCSDGYLRTNIDYQGRRYKPYVHQLVAWAFVPNPDNKPEIHHKDCNPLNNHWTNLQWVTKSEHRALSKLNGQVSHKLKPTDVIDIRNSYSVENEMALAGKYNVNKSTIYLIATGQARSDIKGGIIHELKGATKKIINTKTGEIFKSVELVSMQIGFSVKRLRRSLSGERYNDTVYRYLGEEHLSREKPIKKKDVPFIPHAFGVVVSKKEYSRSRNPYAQWKKVAQYDLAGNLVASYNSIRDAARKIGLSDHKILSKLLNGRKGKTCKGYIWKYV